MPSKPKQTTTEPETPVQAAMETEAIRVLDAKQAPEADGQTGDGGAREEEVAAATEALEAMAETDPLAGIDPGQTVAVLTDHLVELFKHRPKPWSAMSQAEQRDVIAALESNAKETVRHLIERIVSNGKSAVRCMLVGFTDKGDDIKAELKVKALSTDDTEQAVLGLHRARGKIVLVTVASADDYHETAANDTSEPEQPGLGFEAGSDEHPDDDTDLVDAAEAELVKTGDALAFAGDDGQARINLKTGMAEFLADRDEDIESNWQDMRAATSAELAAERDRIADFDDAEEPEEVSAE